MRSTILPRPDELGRDVWETLASLDKPIVMYGMGNGADKILAVLDRYGVTVADFFASDGFVRGHSFQGKTVLSYSDIVKKYDDFAVIVSFASSLPDVTARIRAITAERETYIPDVPVAGGALFDRSFYREHYDVLEETAHLFADDRSRDTFRETVLYKYTGRIEHLDRSESPQSAEGELLPYDTFTSMADLGAYNGDTVRKYTALCPRLASITAFEPDVRNFKKLTACADTMAERIRFRLVNAAAYSFAGTVPFGAEGNRNSSVRAGADAQGRGAHAAAAREIAAQTLDGVLDGEAVDFIKYDVEGAETEALRGSAETIARCAPHLLVSAYHRSEDLFVLPRLVRELYPSYRLYLRRFPYIPAWDLNLYAVPENG